MSPVLLNTRLKAHAHNRPGQYLSRQGEYVRSELWSDRQRCQCPPLQAATTVSVQLIPVYISYCLTSNYSDHTEPSLCPKRFLKLALPYRRSGRQRSVGDLL